MDRQARIDQLMNRYVDGDMAAFEELYRETSPDLLRYLQRHTRDRARAEDLLQTTFAKIHHARGQYDRSHGAMRWIAAIARNALRDDWRRREVRKEDLTSTGAVPESSSNPAEQMGAMHTARRALDLLPPKLRDAIMLTIFGGFTTAEAAEELGTSRSNVKVRAHRGYEMLRTELAEQTI